MVLSPDLKHVCKFFQKKNELTIHGLRHVYITRGARTFDNIFSNNVKSTFGIRVETPIFCLTIKWIQTELKR